MTILRKSLAALAVNARAIPVLVIMVLCQNFGVAHAGEVPSGVTANMATLEDQSGTLTLQDLLQKSSDFKPHAGLDVSAGYTSSTVWVRMTLASAIEQKALVSLSPNFIDFLDVYMATGGQNMSSEAFTHYAFGDHRALPDDGLSGLDNVVAVDLDPSKTTVLYMRLRGVTSALTLSVDIYPPASHVTMVTLSSLALGAWFGGMAALIIVQLVFFGSDRRASHVLIACSTLGAILVYSGTAGLSRLLIFPHGGPANDIFTALSVWFGLIATACAATSVLKLYKTRGIVFWLAMLSIALGILGIILTLAGYHREFAPLGSIVLLIAGAGLVVESARSVNNGGLEKQLEFAAYMALFLGLAITLVQRLGILAIPLWNGHAYAISNMVHAILLTGAMAEQLRAAEAQNLTLQREAFKKINAAYESASELVKERTAALSEAKQVAEDALKAELTAQRQQIHFMEVISHQYRTPLAGLRSNVESIGLSLPPTDKPNRQRLDRIRSSVVRLVEVLEVNLARSRLQGSRFEPDQVHTNFEQMLLRARSRAQDLFNGATIELIVAPETRTSTIAIDEDMISIALMNLVENAVKFSTGPAPKVQLVGKAVREMAVIEVIDQGIGIPSGELDNVRGSANRGSNARHIEGTGLGLSLVDRIVAAHGGSLELESRNGEGTIAIVRLPLR